MSGRIALLIAATALFIRVWLPTKHCAPGVPVARTVTTSCGLAAAKRCLSHQIAATETASSGHEESAATTREGIAASPATETTSIEHWTTSTAPISLPPDLEPGQYRVVDQSGRVALLEAAPSDDSFDSPVPRGAAPEFFVIRDGSTSWYFVRLTAGTQIASKSIAAPSTVAVPRDTLVPQYSTTVPAFTNPKFDFRGYADETEPLLPTFGEPPQNVDAATAGTPADGTTAAARHASLRWALMQRDAERKLREAGNRIAAWWQRTSVTLRQAGSPSTHPSL
jgi:hypothetical protein